MLLSLEICLKYLKKFVYTIWSARKVSSLQKKVLLYHIQYHAGQHFKKRLNRVKIHARYCLNNVKHTYAALQMTMIDKNTCLLWRL